MVGTANEAVFWDRIARKYAADAIADAQGYERSLSHTLRYLNGGDRAFEFGCGTGSTALRLALSVGQILATDISPKMIAIAREKAEAAACPNVRFEVAGPGWDDLPDGGFDAALGFNVLHLVAHRAAVLKAVHRLLKPGGLLITKTPCLKEMGLGLRLALPLALPVMQALGRAPFVAFFCAEELERAITDAGFEIVERDRHGTRGKDFRAFLVARRV
jgi:ubiquinone/menaquinone biosynthesis C-methylase UbiE